jgi:hypothetical protein
MFEWNSAITERIIAVEVLDLDVDLDFRKVRCPGRFSHVCSKVGLETFPEEEASVRINMGVSVDDLEAITSRLNCRDLSND